MGLESITEKAAQGWAKALQYQTTQRGIYTAVSRKSLSTEVNKRAMEDRQIKERERDKQREKKMCKAMGKKRYRIYKVFKMNKKRVEREQKIGERSEKVHEVSVQISYLQSSCSWTLMYLIY